MAELAGGDSRLIAGRYRLEARIGKGGIGEVWRARHLTLNSFVAIKFLQGASAQNEATRRRFTTEAQVTAQLKSQHAVQVFDFGVTEDGHPYLVMELLEGETLGRRLERQERIDILDTARLLGQSARALHRAHQLGIVHRDFKPDNIVIATDDEGRDYVKVVDFGLAKLVGDLDSPLPSDVAEAMTAVPTATFTKTGAMLGTPFYMAPEQVRSAANVNLRADIWAFGVVAFECLTGCPPFVGETLFELFQNIENGRHPDADKLEPSVPPGFLAWFDTACATDPAKRFPDAMTAWKQLLVALECGKVDINPSLARGRALSSSGERLAANEVPRAAPDANAVTLDVSTGRGLEERRRSIGARSSRARAIEAAPPLASEAQALAHTIAAEEAHARNAVDIAEPKQTRMGARGGAVRRGLLVVAAVLLAAFVVATWRRGGASSPSAANAAPPVTSVAPAPAPSASIAATPVGAVAEAPPASPSLLQLPQVSPPATPRALAPRPRPHATGAPSVAASARATPTAPPPPAAPAPTSSEPSDPGSYR